MHSQEQGSSQVASSTQMVYQFTPLGKALEDAVNEM
jgi:hypothetical protein